MLVLGLWRNAVDHIDNDVDHVDNDVDHVKSFDLIILAVKCRSKFYNLDGSSKDF